MPIVNNVTRLLDSRKIPYTAFELPLEKLGALETARLLDVDPATVYKTIVVTREKPKKPLLVVIPGPNQVDLKALAAVPGEEHRAPASVAPGAGTRRPGTRLRRVGLRG